MTPVLNKFRWLSAYAKDTESKPAAQTIDPPLAEQDKRDIVCQREHPFYVNTAGNPGLLYPLVRMLKSGQSTLLKSLAAITIPEAPNMSQQEWQIVWFRVQLMVSDGPKVSVCEIWNDHSLDKHQALRCLCVLFLKGPFFIFPLRINMGMINVGVKLGSLGML